jgi:hypothetical protein
VQGPLLLGKSCLRKVHPQSQRLFAEVWCNARTLAGNPPSRTDCRCCSKIMAADTLPIGIPLGGRWVNQSVSWFIGTFHRQWDVTDSSNIWGTFFYIH